MGCSDDQQHPFVPQSLHPQSIHLGVLGTRHAISFTTGLYSAVTPGYHPLGYHKRFTHTSPLSSDAPRGAGWAWRRSHISGYCSVVVHAGEMAAPAFDVFSTLDIKRTRVIYRFVPLFYKYSHQLTPSTFSINIINGSHPPGAIMADRKARPRIDVSHVRSIRRMSRSIPTRLPILANN